MNDSSGRGLPARVYLPIVVVVGLALLGAIGYLLRIGLNSEGSAISTGVVPAVTASPQAGPNGP
ncbi:MAG: hypothetical protein ABI346_06980 [Candidatus Baltobacteraceae bacterium]